MSIVDADKAIQDFYDHMWGEESKEVNGVKEVKIGLLSYATDYTTILYKLWSGERDGKEK